jgi:hypothetical protein
VLYREQKFLVHGESRTAQFRWLESYLDKPTICCRELTVIFLAEMLLKGELRLMKKLGLLVFVIQALNAQTSPCDVNHDGTVNIADVQTMINEALGVAACTTDLDGNGKCDVIDVQIVITAALGGPCNAAQPVQSSIQLPIEVIGLDGTTKSVSFSVPAGANLSGATQLSMQIHGLQYQTQGSVQLNSSGWMPVNNTTVTLLGLANAYGGIGGGFHTLKLTMNLPPGSVTTGTNTISFKFNGTDGRVSGFRVLGFNVQDSSGNSLIPSTAFNWEDPNTWQPPSSLASYIATGKTLWNTAALTVPTSAGGKPILAHCTDCHAQDGRDLKYFNYSNNSIRSRSMFHGLTAQQGDQIASYIRTLNVPNPGRPWNPPYQPGPGLDSLPATNWAAGAGLGAVLDSDAAMLPHLAPGGSTAGWAANQYLNPRETPIALQLLDWNTWLPGIHPLDAAGASFTASSFNTSYSAIRTALQPKTTDAYGNALYLFDIWSVASQDFFGPLEQKTTWTATDRQALYSAALWMMVKLWEINQEFGLEGMPQVPFHAKANARGWFTTQPFNTSPILLHLPPGPGLGNGSAAVQEYLGFMWYHIQLLLNDGNGAQANHNPIDHPYVQGAVHGLSSTANGTPESMLLLEWMIKALQEETQIGKGPEYGYLTGFQPYYMQPLILVHPVWDSLWSATPSTTRASLTQAYIQHWFAQVSSYTTAQYYTGKNGDGIPWASPTENPAKDDALTLFGGQVWYMLPRLRFVGVDPNLTYQISAWAKTVWPAGNWAQNNAMTCETSVLTCN